MPKPHEYLHIAIWHKRSGSFRYYIIREQEEAARCNAPLDAIYRLFDSQGHTMSWRLASDLPDDHDHWQLYKQYAEPPAQSRA